MKNLRCFIVKYLGATNSLGARVKIIDARFAMSKTISRSLYDSDSGTADAIKYLKSKGIEIKFQAWSEREGNNDVYLLTDNFTNQVK
jgi:hypothetical protein